MQTLNMRMVALLGGTIYHSDTLCSIRTSAAQEGLAVETSVPLFLLRSILNAITNTVSLTQLGPAGCCLRTELSRVTLIFTWGGQSLYLVYMIVSRLSTPPRKCLVWSTLLRPFDLCYVTRIKTSL